MELLLAEQMEPETIVSLPQFVELALSLSKKRGIYFRGMSSTWYKVVPSIARPETILHAGKPIPKHNIYEQERALLYRFRRHTYEQRGRLLNNWEALFVARHHDLPTRLLDWTSNPFVALYFACCFQNAAENTSDGVIWWVKRKWRNTYVDVFDDRIDPLDYKGIQFVFPFYPTTRMTAQSGIFTIHSPEYWEDLATMSADVLDHEKPVKKGEGATEEARRQVRIDILTGGRWRVRRGKKRELIRALQRFGITAGTLFPELDGLSKGLVQSEVFRAKQEYPDTN